MTCFITFLWYLHQTPCLEIFTIFPIWSSPQFVRYNQKLVVVACSLNTWWVLEVRQEYPSAYQKSLKIFWTLLNYCLCSKTKVNLLLQLNKWTNFICHYIVYLVCSLFRTWEIGKAVRSSRQGKSKTFIRLALFTLSNNTEEFFNWTAGALFSPLLILDLC